jgi:hypothetical protein
VTERRAIPARRTDNASFIDVRVVAAPVAAHDRDGLFIFELVPLARIALDVYPLEGFAILIRAIGTLTLA